MTLKEKLFLKLYCYTKLPIISYCRPKILEVNSRSVKILIPLKRRTKNHLGSMYFGALSVGADFTAGLLVMASIKKNKSKAKLIFKDFKADFIKRATSDVVFICNDYNEAKKAVIKNLNTNKRISFNLKVEAFCDNELVARFTLNTSIK